MRILGSRSTLKSISPHQLWIGFFGVWLMLLSGVLSSFLGSPGWLQAYRLNNLLELKKAQLSKAQEDLKKLQFDTHRLETSRIAQEREIRRVLGYAGPDELIFDFRSAQQFN